VTPISIITTGVAEKKGVVSPQLLPDLAMLDGDLLTSLPPHVAAATGIDSMVHAIEVPYPQPASSPLQAASRQHRRAPPCGSGPILHTHTQITSDCGRSRPTTAEHRPALRPPLFLVPPLLRAERLRARHLVRQAYTSVPKKNMLSDLLALLGGHIRTICDPQAVGVRSPELAAARSAMMLGSCYAGMAFANAPVAAVHALAYPLGSHYHVPHGLSNSLVLPHVLDFNAAEPTALEQYTPQHANPTHRPHTPTTHTPTTHASPKHRPHTRRPHTPNGAHAQDVAPSRPAVASQLPRVHAAARACAVPAACACANCAFVCECVCRAHCACVCHDIPDLPSSRRC
jgi:hypothetical protein